ncbi:hypothetical protein [Spiroplasma turonicum]|nr:hypothetical protein [Spiroplasma turonicum]
MSFLMRLFAPKNFKYLFWFHNLLFFISIYWEYLYWKNKNYKLKVFDKTSFNFIENTLLLINIFYLINSTIFIYTDLKSYGNGLMGDLINWVVNKSDLNYWLSFLLIIFNFYLLITSIMFMFFIMLFKIDVNLLERKYIYKMGLIISGLFSFTFILNKKYIFNENQKNNNERVS